MTDERACGDGSWLAAVDGFRAPGNRSPRRFFNSRSYKGSLVFLAECIDPEAPEWAYSTCREPIQVVAPSSIAARTRLALVHFLRPPANSLVDRFSGICRNPWLDAAIVRVRRQAALDPSVRVLQDRE